MQGIVSTDSATYREALRRLREVLAQLYPDATSARRVVADAELATHLIDFSGNAANCWHNILSEAEKSANGLQRLIVVVQSEYSTNPALLVAIERVQTSLGALSKPLQTTSSIDPSDRLLQSAIRRLRQQTEQILPKASASIRGIEVPRVEIEQIERLLHEQQPVLVTGKAGVGKSGIAHQLARSAIDEGRHVLLFDARQLAGVTNPVELRNLLELDESIYEAIARIGQAGGCRVVIDQLDSIFETLTAEFLKSFALRCSQLPQVQTIVVARNSDRKGGCLDQLQAKGFQRVEIEPLLRSAVQQLLPRLGIQQDSDPLFELGSNLLNLDILSRIYQENPQLDLAKINSEVALWQSYFDAIYAHEQVRNAPDFADEFIQEAVDLAWKSLQSAEQTVMLERRTRAQQRLLAWDILQTEHDDIFRFRHEQIRDYLAALDCVKRDRAVVELLQMCDSHRTASIIEWMDKLYASRPTQYRERFIENYLSLNGNLPFYSQSALLDRYLHIDVAQENAEIIDCMLEIVKVYKDLRVYFFQSMPHVSWMEKLWAHDFLTTPPPLRIDEQGRSFVMPWDTQLYLTALASEVPDVVLRHVASVEGESTYLRYAIDALCKIPAAQSATLLPRILNWIQNPILADRIDHSVHQLLLHFAQAGLEEPAFTLFEAMITPIATDDDPPPGLWRSNRHDIKPRVDYYNMFNQELPLLSAINVQRLIQILERQVRSLAMLLTDTSHGIPYPAHWRSAIEATDQDSERNFKDRLVAALRKTLEELAKTNSDTIRQWIERYLLDEHSIFRRLAIHLLATFPSTFLDLVAAQLLNPENLDDAHIHHEFFILLHNGYCALTPTEQAELVAYICAGHSAEGLAIRKQSMQQRYATDIEQELIADERCWIRDRLWMIREHLSGENAALLAALVVEHGEPSHPEFNSWHGNFEWISMHARSPFSEEQIAMMNPDELVSEIQNWSPPKDVSVIRRPTLQGLAGTIARVVVADPIHYAEHINRVLRLGPTFSGTIFNFFANENNSPIVPWHFCLSLIETILHNPINEIRNGEIEEIDWRSVRLSIVRLLQRGFHQSTRFPIEVYGCVEALLLELVNDPDPDAESEGPFSESTGFNDPYTRSLNHVRPIALALLIDLQVEKSQTITPNSGPMNDANRTFEPAICKAISIRLDTATETSPIVRAVFGHYLLSLSWLDREWTSTHLDQIFPVDESPESVILFQAAFETFLVCYPYCNYTALRKLLYPKYAFAIQRIAPLTKRGHLDPIQALVQHIVADYLFSEYDIAESISENNLLGMFFIYASQEARDQAAWVIWRLCTDRPEQFWPKVKLLWLRRLNIVKGVGKLIEFQHEFCWYVQLLPTISSQESFAELWDMILSTLPYVFSTAETYNAWDELEKYLEQQVVQDQLRTIELYRIMRTYTNDPYKFEPNDTRRKILETAAANEQSRSAALSLIDSIGRLGVHGYRDIYERYR